MENDEKPPIAEKSSILRHVCWFMIIVTSLMAIVCWGCCGCQFLIAYGILFFIFVYLDFDIWRDMHAK
jgi:hypothetical protein